MIGAFMDEDTFKKKALELRQKTFSAFIEHGESHLGGSFSIIEILIALFNGVLNNVNDKFILSKSHASYPYCILMRERGFNVPIKTHLERDESSGIYATTGSLGHGLPISTGIAFAMKVKKIDGRVYVLMSDGECQEGTTWESLLIASAKCLDNLVVIIDSNKLQAIDFVENILPLGSLVEKFQAFGWDCEDVDGHESITNLVRVLSKPNTVNRPKAVIVNTTKGKGIPEFENKPEWHAKKIKGENVLIGKKALGIL